jgi:hypothetical protein
MATDGLAELIRKLENERDPRRRAQLATALGTRLIRAANQKNRKPPPKPLREPEPAPRSKWRPLRDLRSLLRHPNKEGPVS